MSSLNVVLNVTLKLPLPVLQHLSYNSAVRVRHLGDVGAAAEEGLAGREDVNARGVLGLRPTKKECTMKDACTRRCGPQSKLLKSS